MEDISSEREESFPNDYSLGNSRKEFTSDDDDQSLESCEMSVDDFEDETQENIIGLMSTILMSEQHTNQANNIFDCSQSPDAFFANRELLYRQFLHLQSSLTELHQGLRCLSNALYDDETTLGLLDAAKTIVKEIQEHAESSRRATLRVEAQVASDQSPRSTLPTERRLFQSPSNAPGDDSSLDDGMMGNVGLHGNENSFDAIDQRWKLLTNGSQVLVPQLMVIDTTILTQVQDTVDSIFDTSNPNLSRLAILVRDTICSLSSLARVNRAYVERKRVKAGNKAVANLDATPDYDTTRSYADIILECEYNNQSAAIEGERPPAVTALLHKTKLAIHRNNVRDDTAQSGDLDEDISDDALYRIIQIGPPTRKLTSHALNIAIAYELISNLTVYRLYALLGKRDALINEAKKLAKGVNPNIVFDKHTTIRAYLENFALPGLEKDDEWRAASAVICAML